MSGTLPVINLESGGSAAKPIRKVGLCVPGLAWPIITALVIRLTLLGALLFQGGSSALTKNDAASYMEPGRNLLLHGSFTADGVPDLLRTPGYALFLAITSLPGIPAAAAANVILSACSVMLVWKLALALFHDDRIAISAAWIFVFEPLSVIHSVFPLSETLFTALILVTVERVIEFLRGRRLRVLFAAGLCLAAATFVRPIAYYLPVTLAFGLFLVLARERGLRWKAPAVLLISVLPFLAGWQIRNWSETGYGGFASISDVNLYSYVAADVTARVEHRNLFAVRRDLGMEVGAIHSGSGQSYLSQAYLARHPEQVGWPQSRRLAFMHSEAVQVIRAHSEVYLGSIFRTLPGILFSSGAGFVDHPLIPEDSVRDARFIHGDLLSLGPARWWAEFVKEYPEDYPWAMAERVAFTAILLGLSAFAIRGVFRSGKGNTGLWLLLGTCLYLIAVSAAGAAPIADSRFRQPVMPAVCILAAAGIQRKKTLGR
ncbi:MAG: hypothetical protein ABSG96_13990 [Terracidiphilus sp.]